MEIPQFCLSASVSRAICQLRSPCERFSEVSCSVIRWEWGHSQFVWPWRKQRALPIWTHFRVASALNPTRTDRARKGTWCCVPLFQCVQGVSWLLSSCALGLGVGGDGGGGGGMGPHGWAGREGDTRITILRLPVDWVLILTRLIAILARSQIFPKRARPLFSPPSNSFRSVTFSHASSLSFFFVTHNLSKPLLPYLWNFVLFDKK